MEKLKPCPFCGQEPETWWDSQDESEGYNISCCDINIFCVYKDEAIEAWNNRKSEREYQKYEFCKAVDCRKLYVNHSKDCTFTAKEFHHWLKENGFKIVKEG